MRDTSPWLHGEASIDDFMADPIVQLVMRSDRVSVGELRALLRTASEKLTRAPERATDAQTDTQNPPNSEPKTTTQPTNP